MVVGQFGNWLHWLINLVDVACVCICTLNVFWFTMDVFGHPGRAHFGISKSIPAHSQYLSTLFS